MILIRILSIVFFGEFYVVSIRAKLIGSEFKVQGLPAFGGAVGDQGSKVITD
jgi:hypothetical protein